ncbi:MAG: pyrroline-5-carboxylate reductase [Erysipelotrichaceae bacterium]
MKLGFIGAGNMAKAMLGGIIGSNLIAKEEIIASDAYLPSLEAAKKELGINITTNNIEVASNCEVVVLAVKPQFYASVIEEIKDVISENTIIVTIAPGQTLERLKGQFGKNVKIVRCMPNTPAMVNEGMTAAVPNEFVTKEESAYICSLLDGFGKSAIVKEYMMDGVVAVSGSAPAYVFMFIEALADGAVRSGMPRVDAYKFAAQAVLGSAKMVLETGKHPADLKDMVCSPAGTTIEAVAVLEQEGFRNAVLAAMDACVKKASSM